MKTLIENINSRYFNYVAIIPNSSTCTMWPKYPETKMVEKKRTNAPLRPHVLHKTLNVTLLFCRKNVPNLKTHARAERIFFGLFVLFCFCVVVLGFVWGFFARYHVTNFLLITT